ncbi:hypothetical protein QYM36_002454, partial [Artemia franciscana]
WATFAIFLFSSFNKNNLQESYYLESSRIIQWLSTSTIACTRGRVSRVAEVCQVQNDVISANHEEGGRGGILLHLTDYAAELHLVHWNRKYRNLDEALGNKDGLTVLGIFIEATEKDNENMEPFLRLLEDVKDAGANVTGMGLDFALKDVLPEDLSKFYRYHGSLTTPSCNEVVFWTMFDTPVTASDRQLKEFRQLLAEDGSALVDNFRPPQNLGTRTVYVRAGAAFTTSSVLTVTAALIIQKLSQSSVTHPTDWVNSVVIVEKPDKSLRICIDPHDLNKAIKRPHHPMPTFDEAIQKHEGAKFFTKLYARHGYWSIVLDEKSSELTTFATPFGRFKFRRMPFGLISAQDEFQRRMEEAFEGVPGFSVIVDDIIVSGKSETEHDVNTQAALTRARERTVKLNKAKCILKSKSIPYFGHVISKDGIHPDPNKVNALKEMPRPRNREELQTLLGMLNYLSCYIPNLSSQNEPLRTLSKQQKFVWEEVHDNAFDTIKKSICSTIPPFNPSVGNLELQVDASKSGLGAVLIRNENIISFSSHSLNTTEQKYSQIEKELYAIVFGIRHFHQYLYGHSFVVVTDHKPLETLINRSMQNSSPRLQRMLLLIQPYDLTVIFRPGKEIPVPDTLSRLYLQSQDEKLKQGQSVEAQIHGKSWEPAVVLHKHELPRSYFVQTQDMKAYRRNRKYPQMTQI